MIPGHRTRNGIRGELAIDRGLDEPLCIVTIQITIVYNSLGHLNAATRDGDTDFGWTTPRQTKAHSPSDGIVEC